ncbi:MAG TPA: MIP/aquaporin family protein [Chitinophagaceae bacterium]|jgi:glycerol uptake facilitator protein|nr:MIP/aquaporin family protein [Chitinophagaceae bacterium]
MNPYVAELIGTAFLILLGNGVVANVLLMKSKGLNGGWIAITFGWAIAVFVGVYITAPFSGGHINPAVTIGLALAGKFAWSKVLPYIAAQMVGAMIGALLSWLCYKKHYDEQNDPELVLMSFCTVPAIRSLFHNAITELIGTFVLIFGVLYLAKPDIGLGSLDALPVALLVLGIGLSLGGPTGYAINPARDLGPRIIHAWLPIGGKRDSDWRYSWVPVVAPIVGAALAAWLYLLIKP